MKAGFYIAVLFSALMLMGSCQEEVVVEDDDLLHTWEATMFVSVDSVDYEKNENKPILLSFQKDGTYSLKLDINSCGGTYQAGKDRTIQLEFPVCTDACCDSPFSNKLAGMLREVTSYSIEENRLQLNVPGWGYLELELVE